VPKAAKKKATSKGASPSRRSSTQKSSGSRAQRKAAASKAPASKPAPKKGAKSGKRGSRKANGQGDDRIDAIKRAATRPTLHPVGEPASRSRDEPSDDSSGKRNFGLRGAAPWVARHAAKHAEELRKRNEEPPPPGSARATLRVPPEAEQIKTKIGELHTLTSKIRSLRKRLDKSFYEIGEVLSEVQRKHLFEAKGYSSFEAFLDREIDLPRSVSLRLIRICHTFHRDTAYDFGMERLTTALAALDGELMTAPPSHPSSRGFSSTALPLKPPFRWED
jgi:hypothetical protein